MQAIRDSGENNIAVTIGDFSWFMNAVVTYRQEIECVLPEQWDLFWAISQQLENWKILDSGRAKRLRKRFGAVTVTSPLHPPVKAELRASP
jgi:hypothetical protein